MERCVSYDYDSKYNHYLKYYAGWAVRDIEEDEINNLCIAEKWRG